MKFPSVVFATMAIASATVAWPTTGATTSNDSNNARRFRSFASIRGSASSSSSYSSIHLTKDDNDRRRRRELSTNTTTTGGTPIAYSGNNGDPSEAFPLSLCQSDCDGDGDCEYGLVCFDRDDDDEALP